MACSSCGSSVVYSVNRQAPRASRIAEQIGPCEYTNVILQAQYDKLRWFKDNALYIKYGYKASLINKYLGTVLSALNSNNKCTYKETLDTITTLVTFITSIQE